MARPRTAGQSASSRRRLPACGGLFPPALKAALLLVLASLLVLACGTSRAEHRAALLIGNRAYPNAPLVSPPHDLAAVGAALHARGFTVTTIRYADARTFLAAVTNFARSVATRGTALVYFSGYALRGGEGQNADNYLLPVDAQPVNLSSITQTRIGVRYVLQHLQTLSGSAANLVLVDGCYAHPRPSKNVNFTLQPVPRFPPESLALYAAPLGTVIAPVADGISPFAAKLVAALQSKQTLREILEQLSSTRESSLETLAALASPAARASSPPTELKPGTTAGEEWVNPLGMVFCWCPPGSYQMGSPPDAALRGDDEAQRRVTFPQGFWMAKYEVTRQQIFALIGRHTYLSTGTHKLQPLDKFRVADAKTWLAALNTDAPARWRYAVPTEEEWEYAARAGTTTPFYFGPSISDLAQHGNFADVNLFASEDGFHTYAGRTLDDGSRGTAKVGSYRPNPWGLHDVYGNLSELCDTPYAAPNVKPNQYANLVIRGGSWLSTPATCRSAYRNFFSFGASENIVPNHVGYRFIIRPTAP